MRESMVAQSRLNPTGAKSSGTSVGFNDDGFKLGGGRYDPNVTAGNPQVPSTLGGIQGGQGKVFGIDYQPGSFTDHVVEAYAGVHDFGNNPFVYDASGNIQTGMSAAQQAVGGVMNYANVALATPIVAASVIGIAPGALAAAVNMSTTGSDDSVAGPNDVYADEPLGVAAEPTVEPQSDYIPMYQEGGILR